MQGTIQNPANQNGQGVILGDDGITYTYTMLGWRDAATPATSGMRVDFDTRGAHAVAIYAVPDALRPLANPAPPPMAPQAPPAAVASSGMASHRQPTPIPTTGHVGSSPLAPGQPTSIPTGAHVGSSPLAPGQQPTVIPTTGHVGTSPLAPGQPARTPTAGPMAAGHVGTAPAGQPANYPTAGQVGYPPIGSGPPAQPPAAPVGVPSAAAPQLPAQRSRTKLFIAVAAAFMAVGILAVGAFWFLQQPRSDEEIAAQVAREWTESSIDDISEMVMGLIVGNAPIVADLGANVLAERIRERVSWSYSDPNCPREGQCTMTATANASFEINIPFVLDETVTAKMPLDLYIDTDERQVANWNVDIRSASVSGIELGGMAGAAEAAIAASSDDIMRAVGKIRQFADEEDYAGVFQDASDTWDSFVDDDAWQSFADEFDMDSAIDDASDAWDDFTSNSDFEDTFEDASDAWDDFTSDSDFEDTFEDASDAWDDFSSDSDIGGAMEDVGESIGGFFGN